MHESKALAFNHAMERYYRYAIYHQSGWFISSLIIVLQLATLVNLLSTEANANVTIAASVFILAYVVADFISGVVHVYMDNNQNYESLAGPFVAAFHLHHKSPSYKNRHALKIYFFESGTKWWLAIYLSTLFYCQINFAPQFYTNLFFVSVGILSSVAEVSHYWCHNSRKDQWLVTTLQSCRILLSKKHHAHHHASDNKNYAFLNGITDPLINVLAKKWYAGYKNHADLHVSAYTGGQTANR